MTTFARVAPADADPALVATQRQLLLSQVSELHAKVAALTDTSDFTVNDWLFLWYGYRDVLPAEYF